MSELTYPGSAKVHDRGVIVRRLQEWLNLHSFAIDIDGVFGPRTAEALVDFQKKNALRSTAALNSETWRALTAPMRRALLPPTELTTMSDAIVAVARMHTSARPREVGGENRGPWVRLYMNGNEGADWRWCAGFATAVLSQAARAGGWTSPVARTFLCDALGAAAMKKGTFVPGAGRSEVKPGSLFLKRRVSTGWSHTGFVVATDHDGFSTIEGNTNLAGSTDGDGAYERWRPWSGYDFIRI